MSISVKNYWIHGLVCMLCMIAGGIIFSIPTQAQSLPGLGSAMEAQLTPVIERVYRNDKTQFQGVKTYLEIYVLTADQNNTKRKIASDIHLLMQKIENPSSIPTLTDAQVQTILNHIPETPSERSVLILEFSDLECPFCQRHHNNGTLGQVETKYPYVKSYFFDFPLGFHHQANPGAMMRQCVQRYQGYDAMMTYIDKAMELGMRSKNDPLQALYNMGYTGATQQEILDCYDNTQTQKGVDAQMDLGRSLGVSGTPGNVVIDRYTKAYTKVSGAVPATSFDRPIMQIASGELDGRAAGQVYTAISPSYMVVPTPQPTPQPVAPTQANPAAYETFLETAYISGNTDAKVSVIEFSDFQCPFCQRHANNGTLDQVAEKYGNDVNVIFAHYPLGFHANAQKAGEALECAGAQGGMEGFFAMKKAYFAAGGDSNMTIAQTAATSVGLDADMMMDCVNAGTYAQKVKDQMAFGQSLGVTGTPGNIVMNNRTQEFIKVSGAVPAASFDAPITSLLADNSAAGVYVPTPAQPTAAPISNTVDLDAYIEFLGGVYIYGNQEAKVSLIEFSDVQCPFCQRHANNGTLDTVAAKYGNDVNVIFAHYPLGFHANAQKAGEALECAGAQGGMEGFFAMKKAYFAAGGDSNMTIAQTAATSVGLDADMMMDCVNAGTYAQKVKDQMAFGQSLGVTGTPGNIVMNNRTQEFIKVSGAVPAASFDAAVFNYLK